MSEEERPMTDAEFIAARKELDEARAAYEETPLYKADGKLFAIRRRVENLRRELDAAMARESKLQEIFSAAQRDARQVDLLDKLNAAGRSVYYERRRRLFAGEAEPEVSKP